MFAIWFVSYELCEWCGIEKTGVSDYFLSLNGFCLFMAFEYTLLALLGLGFELFTPPSIDMEPLGLLIDIEFFLAKECLLSGLSGFFSFRR